MIRRVPYISKHYPTLADSITYIHGYIGIITVLMTGTTQRLYIYQPINRYPCTDTNLYTIYIQYTVMSAITGTITNYTPYAQNLKASLVYNKHAIHTLHIY